MRTEQTPRTEIRHNPLIDLTSDVNLPISQKISIVATREHGVAGRGLPFNYTNLMPATWHGRISRPVSQALPQSDEFFLEWASAEIGVENGGRVDQLLSFARLPRSVER